MGGVVGAGVGGVVGAVVGGVVGEVVGGVVGAVVGGVVGAVVGAARGAQRVRCAFASSSQHARAQAQVELLALCSSSQLARHVTQA